jgi:hypothetical protein
MSAGQHIENSKAPLPHRLKVELDLDLADDNTDEIKLLLKSLLTAGYGFPTRTSLTAKISLTNLNDTLFPGGKIERVYLDGGDYTANIGEDVRLTSIPGGAKATLEPIEAVIPAPGMTWLKATASSTDKLPVHLLRDLDDIWSGELMIGFSAVDLDAALQTAYLRRIAESYNRLGKQTT